jgi:hypothetical protein
MSFFLLSFSILEEDIDKDIKAEESKVEMQSISIDSFFNLTYPLIQFDQDTLDEKVFKMALSGYA